MRSLKEAVAALKRAPDSSVVAEVDGVVVELRIPKRRTADDIFQEVGPWEGETAAELSQLIREARDQGGSKDPEILAPPAPLRFLRIGKPQGAQGARRMAVPRGVGAGDRDPSGDRAPGDEVSTAPRKLLTRAERPGQEILAELGATDVARHAARD